MFIPSIVKFRLQNTVLGYKLPYSEETILLIEKVLGIFKRFLPSPRDNITNHSK